MSLSLPAVAAVIGAFFAQTGDLSPGEAARPLEAKMRDSVNATGPINLTWPYRFFEPNILERFRGSRGATTCGYLSYRNQAGSFKIVILLTKHPRTGWDFFLDEADEDEVAQTCEDYRASGRLIPSK